MNQLGAFDLLYSLAFGMKQLGPEATFLATLLTRIIIFTFTFVSSSSSYSPGGKNAHWLAFEEPSVLGGEEKDGGGLGFIGERKRKGCGRGTRRGWRGVGGERRRKGRGRRWRNRVSFTWRGWGWGKLRKLVSQTKRTYARWLAMFGVLLATTMGHEPPNDVLVFWGWSWKGCHFWRCRFWSEEKWLIYREWDEGRKKLAGWGCVSLSVIVHGCFLSEGSFWRYLHASWKILLGICLGLKWTTLIDACGLRPWFWWVLILWKRPNPFSGAAWKITSLRAKIKATLFWLTTLNHSTQLSLFLLLFPNKANYSFIFWTPLIFIKCILLLLTHLH